MAAEEAAGREADSRFRALIVDYGGVLTSGMPDAMGDFCSAHDVERSSLDEVLRGLAGDGVTLGEIQDLETGAISVAEFEQVLAGRLRTRGGNPLEAPGLVRRLFAGFQRETAMVGAVRRAREHGLRTALLSNSWGVDEYPRGDWDELFDAVVISGEVRLRKPQPEIYLLTARRLGVAPEECVFVDDLMPNIRGAVAAGMCGVHHVDAPTTLAELESLLGFPSAEGLGSVQP